VNKLTKAMLNTQREVSGTILLSLLLAAIVWLIVAQETQQAGKPVSEFKPQQASEQVLADQSEGTTLR